MNFKNFRKKLFFVFLFSGLLTGAFETVYSSGGVEKLRRSKHRLSAAKKDLSDGHRSDRAARTTETGGEKAVEQPKRNPADDSPVRALGEARQIDVLAIAPLVQTAKLTHNGAPGDNFGSSVFISGDTAVVGVPGDSLDSENRGAAYIFVRSGTSWIQQARLVASDGSANDLFGFSVAVSGNTVVVGAPGDDAPGSGINSDQGSAYVFTRTGTTWTQQQRLSAGVAADLDLFGASVAIEGDTIAVGAIESLFTTPSNRRGSTYVFVRSGANWTQQARIFTPDVSSDAFFGSSVAISADTLIVGAAGDDVGGNDEQGSAFIFTRSGTNWSQQAKLTAIGGELEDLFGSSVAIEGNTAVVGAPFNNVGENIVQGSAYVFVRSGTTWVQQARLNNTNGQADDTFGDSVGISNENIIVGASGDDIGTKIDQGSAFIFTRSGANWSQQQQLNAGDGDALDVFGTSVAISGNNVIVGAFGDNEDQGAAYIFAPAATQAAPTVTSIEPNVRGAGSAAFEIVVNGTGFLSNSVVRFNGQNRTTTFVSATQLRAQITAADLAAAGQFPVTVLQAGGEVSNAVSLTVLACAYSINPTSQSFAASGGTGSFTVTTTDGCAAAAVSGSSSITVTGGGSGTGTRTVSYTVAANTGAARTGSISIGGQVFTVNQAAGASVTPRRKTKFDFDGDGRSDLSVFRPSNGSWYILSSSGTYTVTTFGANGDVPVAADYDGDGISDIAVFRPSNSSWYILSSLRKDYTVTSFGAVGDIPVAADYDGDGISDIAVFRPSNGNWYILSSLRKDYTVTNFGGSGDIPVASDYDGDGISDIAVFRPSNGNWYILSSLRKDYTVTNFGANGDVPVASDYDGDGISDIAVFRPSNGSWYILSSLRKDYTVTQFGASGDVPVATDYDGDGISDLAVFRPSNGSWYIQSSLRKDYTVTGFGANGDIAIPRNSGF